MTHADVNKIPIISWIIELMYKTNSGWTKTIKKLIDTHKYPSRQDVATKIDDTKQDNIIIKC